MSVYPLFFFRISYFKINSYLGLVYFPGFPDNIPKFFLLRKNRQYGTTGGWLPPRSTVDFFFSGCIFLFWWFIIVYENAGSVLIGFGI